MACGVVVTAASEYCLTRHRFFFPLRAVIVNGMGNEVSDDSLQKPGT